MVSEEVRLVAEQYDIDLSEVKGSGPGGEVTLGDL
ncbi:E3 binding domain-containing protein [Thermococcus sp.]